MMERTEILTAMGGLKLFGMRAAYDEIVATAVKRQHEPQRVVGDLLAAELSEKQARSIKYQITVAKLPLAKEIEDFAFAETPVNETLVRDLASGGFLLQQRNLVVNRHRILTPDRRPILTPLRRLWSCGQRGALSKLRRRRSVMSTVGLRARG